MKPLAIDLFCGLGGWTEGLLAEGYRVVGFDIERHEYWVPENEDRADGGKGTHPVEKRGWSQGCAISLGMEGAQSRPRTRLLRYPAQLVLQDVLTLHGSQFKDATLIVASPPCQAYSYRAMPWSRAKALPPPDNTLFEACFRIQHEACEAAGRHVPMVVENVRGAQKWIGRARWNYGSFYLWGDVPALMPDTFRARKHDDSGWRENGTLISCNRMVPDGAKLTGFRFDDSGRSFQSASVEGVKNGNDWFGPGADCSEQRRHGSRSPARKAASAMIAKIPLPLSRHIAAIYHP